MAWKLYQDQENRAYVSILRTLFPEQTKTLPRIIIWSIIFFIDLCVVVIAGRHYGLFGAGWLSGFLGLAVLFGLFWLQGFVWYRITNLFR